MTDPSPEENLGKATRISCAIEPCRAMLYTDEKLICIDCADAIAPLVGEAVLAERERCAKLVEFNEGWHGVRIADAIRKPPA